MVGDAQRMLETRRDSHLKSVRLHGEPAMAEAMPPGGDMSQGTMTSGAMPPGAVPPGAVPPAGSGETMTLTAPQGWTQDPNAGDMRVALFHLPGVGGEATITRFPGRCGGSWPTSTAGASSWPWNPWRTPAGTASQSVVIMAAGQPACFNHIPSPAATARGSACWLSSRPDPK